MERQRKILECASGGKVKASASKPVLGQPARFYTLFGPLLLYWHFAASNAGKTIIILPTVNFHLYASAERWKIQNPSKPSASHEWKDENHIRELPSNYKRQVSDDRHSPPTSSSSFWFVFEKIFVGVDGEVLISQLKLLFMKPISHSYLWQTALKVTA